MGVQLGLGIDSPAEAQAERERCGIDGPDILPCKQLAFALAPQKSWLHFGEMVEMRGSRMRYAVILDFGKRGYLDFKFCPFCGAELATILTERE